MKTYILTAATALSLLAPTTAAAQQPARSEVTIDAIVFGGAVGYARQATPTVMLGAEFGIGVPQVVFTLQPPTGPDGEPELVELLHVALFARFRPTNRLSLDVGARGGMADLYSCTVSDCWPASMMGVYAQPMFGGGRFKVGSRVSGVVVGESRHGGRDSSTFAIGVTPVVFRLAIPW
jgi:hypothetical protein